MSISSKVLEGTYLDFLTTQHSKYTEKDFWALICCGYDLHHPYEGWSGIVAVPVFSDQDISYELYFGDVPDSLAQYENLPGYRVSRDCSKAQAFSEFREFMQTQSSNPVFISANAKTWALPIIREAIEKDCSGEWDVQLICTRNLYSLTAIHGELSNSCEFIGQAFTDAPPLPRRFGLQQIASTMGVSIPDNGIKALHRARQTAKVAELCLSKVYPS